MSPGIGVRGFLEAATPIEPCPYRIATATLGSQQSRDEA
jgi:hypothetical protein